MHMIESIPDYQDLSDEQKIDLHQFKGALDVGANLTGWNDLYLKDELKKAIREIGYEYPSDVQKQAIPIIMQGRDLLCQARSGMGKTAVFTIGVLNQLSMVNGNYIPFNCIVVAHTRELAHQIFKDFRRFSRYFKNPDLRIACFFGGFAVEIQKQELCNKERLPHIVIGTPGRLHTFVRDGLITLDKVEYLVVDECDKVLQSESMKNILQKMYMKMTHSKQVMMFSATLPEKSKKCAKQFMNNEVDIFVDPGKLTLIGLSQFNIHLIQKNKIDTLMMLLDIIKFNQGVIFVNRVQRAKKLTDLLKQKLFNPICLHSSLTQEQRIMSYDKFKQNKSRLLIATDLFGRGIDVQRVNLVINYDLPMDKEGYLHRIGRAGRFNTKGIAVNFVCLIGDQGQEKAYRKDVQVMEEIQKGLSANIPELPQNFDSKLYI